MQCQLVLHQPINRAHFLSESSALHLDFFNCRPPNQDALVSTDRPQRPGQETWAPPKFAPQANPDTAQSARPTAASVREFVACMAPPARLAHLGWLTSSEAMLRTAEPTTEKQKSPLPIEDLRDHSGRPKMFIFLNLPCTFVAWTVSAVSRIRGESLYLICRFLFWPSRQAKHVAALTYCCCQPPPSAR